VAGVAIRLAHALTHECAAQVAQCQLTVVKLEVERVKTVEEKAAEERANEEREVPQPPSIAHTHRPQTRPPHSTYHPLVSSCAD
jgi:hypothetical protein